MMKLRNLTTFTVLLIGLLLLVTAYAGNKCFDKAAQAASKANALSPAAQFEATLFRLPPNERVPVIRAQAEKVASSHGWKKNNKLSTVNKRIIYTDSDGGHWSVDTQHGRFERLDRRGRHLGEYDMDLRFVEGSIDNGKGHNIQVQ